jgi:peptide/nickel transport system substrate-binding protein
VSALRIIKYTSPAYIYLGFNLRDPDHLSRPNPLFQDRDLRRALSRAIDRTTLVRAVFGEYGAAALGPASRMTVIGNDTTLPQLPYDSALASAELDRLGWRKGSDGVRSRNGRQLEFEILVPNSSQVRNRMAVILQDQFRRVGVKATVKVIEFNLFTTRNRAGKFETMLQTWNEDPTPSGIQQTWTTSAIGDANFDGYSNPQFDRLVSEAHLAPDPRTARDQWRDVFRTVNEDAPGIWLACPIQPAGIHRRFENVTIRPDQWTATLWTWRISPGSMIARDRVAAAPSR